MISKIPSLPKSFERLYILCSRSFDNLTPQSPCFQIQAASVFNLVISEIFVIMKIYLYEAQIFYKPQVHTTYTLFNSLNHLLKM